MAAGRARGRRRGARGGAWAGESPPVVVARGQAGGASAGWGSAAGRAERRRDGARAPWPLLPPSRRRIRTGSARRPATTMGGSPSPRPTSGGRADARSPASCDGDPVRAGAKAVRGEPEGGAGSLGGGRRWPTPAATATLLLFLPLPAAGKPSFPMRELLPRSSLAAAPLPT
jgi:hypothetical protein